MFSFQHYSTFKKVLVWLSKLQSWSDFSTEYPNKYQKFSNIFFNQIIYPSLGFDQDYQIPLWQYYFDSHFLFSLRFLSSVCYLSMERNFNLSLLVPQFYSSPRCIIVSLGKLVNWIFLTFVMVFSTQIGSNQVSRFVLYAKQIPFQKSNYVE